MRRAEYDDAIEAVREWHAKHGRLPRRPEWEKAARGRPTTRTIDRRWGWDKLMAKASGRPPAQLREAEFRERRRQLLLKLRAARDDIGRWPTSREWDRAGGDPMSSRGYARTFGSWEAAKRAGARLMFERQAAGSPGGRPAGEASTKLERLPTQLCPPGASGLA